MQLYKIQMEKENINIHIGEKLRELRESRKITQTNLARALSTDKKEITYFTIRRYEIGESPFNIEFLLRLCDFFNVDLNYFLSERRKVVLRSEDNNDIILCVDRKNKGKILQFFNDLKNLADDKIFASLISLMSDLIDLKNKNK